ncbi:MAG TPA: hypothetical protein VGX92_12855 [Pyrinomonadaceae bacterium]|jgi:hypothetical protein|nr:hypothetical protein [Pyrinomonadaceae bacterium]
MLERLTDRDEIADAARRIDELIAAHGEWVYAQASAGGATTALRRNEIDIHVSQNRLIFSCWTEKGVRTWRVRAWEWTGEKLLMDATRRAGAERSRLVLVPRLSTETANIIISAARRERAQHLARLASGVIAGAATVERTALSAGARRGLPGRYARILLRLPQERIAVTGVVAPFQAYDVDAFLSSTLIWFTRARERARLPPIRKLWLIADHRHTAAIAARLALLNEDLRRSISLFVIDDEWRELSRASPLEQEELWTARPARLLRPSKIEPGEWAARIVALAPGAIDVVSARRGETLRYHGLAFARVRRVMSVERVWFGVAGAPRRLLDESTAEDLDKLLRQLIEHRRADAVDRRHALYRLAPEAWLESMLRRDITHLDPGLILSPLYAQFRAAQEEVARGAAAARPIDLLALRRDGRLVVIELKVSEDREHVLQAADYWRRVEAHRRCGNLRRARLFGDAPIADESPLVYLVAPTLRFHRSFATLARAIDPRIETYRFDLNEDWRAGIRVMRRVVT